MPNPRFLVASIGALGLRYICLAAPTHRDQHEAACKAETIRAVGLDVTLQAQDQPAVTLLQSSLSLAEAKSKSSANVVHTRRDKEDAAHKSLTVGSTAVIEAKDERKTAHEILQSGLRNLAHQGRSADGSMSTDSMMQSTQALVDAIPQFHLPIEGALKPSLLSSASVISSPTLSPSLVASLKASSRYEPQIDATHLLATTLGGSASQSGVNVQGTLSTGGAVGPATFRLLEAALRVGTPVPPIAANSSSEVNSTNVTIISPGPSGALAVTAPSADVRGSALLTFPITIGVIAIAMISIPLLRAKANFLEDHARYIAEFVGTFVLSMTVGCCVLIGNSTWNPLAIGLVLMVMIYATGPISGGHLNPAVTISAVLCEKIEMPVAIGYCAAQLSAGVLAACCFTTLFWPAPLSFGPVAPFLWYHAMVVEVIYTFMICFVVNSCALSERNNAKDDGNQFFALAIGFVIVAGGYPAGGVSGACFNPAVSFALDLADPTDGMHWCFLWAVFQVIGACFAAQMFRWTRPEDYKRDLGTGFVPGLRLQCISEFLGTFILVFTVGLNIVTASPATALSAGAALMCMIYSLGDVSGGHFNPAVSLAVVCSGRKKCSPIAGLAFAICQLLAGIFAGFLYVWFHYAGPNKNKAYHLATGIDPYTTDHYSSITAGVLEMVYTFLIAYIVLATATVRRPDSQRTSQNFFFALCIGSSVIVGGNAIGAVSGGELNPAVSIGISTANSVYDGNAEAPAAFWNFLIFSLWELLGGLLAALVFSCTHWREYRESQWKSVPMCFCEFVGTFMLVFTATCVSLVGNPIWGVTAVGSVLMVMIYATGPVSGGNLNPSVSLSLSMCGVLKPDLMIRYVICQIAAGICAGFAAHGLLRNAALTFGPVAPYPWYCSFIIEVIFTTMICFVVNNCAASKRNNSEDDGNQFYALAIGYVVIAGGYAAKSVSGASFNPAVSFGIDLAGYEDGCVWCFAYVAFEVLAAWIAAILFRVLRPEQYTQTQNEEPSLFVRCLSEFLGVFILVFTVGMNVVNLSTATAWSAGAALMCMIYSLGDVSGGHFNPAVTLAVVASGREKCTFSVGALYFLTQMVSGGLAGALYGYFHSKGPMSHTTFGLSPGSGYTMFGAGTAELIFTFVLAYAVLATATVPPAGRGQLKTKKNFYFALCIGQSVTVGGTAIGKISGGVLNPAVSFGFSIATAVHRGIQTPPMFETFILYSLWQLCGGLIAALVFHITHPREYTEKVVPSM